MYNKRAPMMILLIGPKLYSSFVDRLQKSIAINYAKCNCFNGNEENEQRVWVAEGPGEEVAEESSSNVAVSISATMKNHGPQKVAFISVPLHYYSPTTVE